MKSRFLLLFPYLFAILVIGFIVIGGVHSRLGGEAPGASSLALSVYVDPVCHMEVGKGIAHEYNGQAYYFCCEQCRESFKLDPQRYLADVCLVCKSNKVFMPVRDDSAFKATWQAKTYLFCSAAHRDAFTDDPAGFFMHTMWGIPPWLYYLSIAGILIISFGIIEWREDRSENSAVEPSSGPRFDLMQIKWFRRFITSGITRFILRTVFVVLFLTIIMAGLFGNQLPSKNIAPILTWTVWWCGLVMLIMYAGKAWCYVCPWDAISDWSEGLSLWGNKRAGLSLGIAWPKFMANIWPATILFVGLTWVELGFHVTMNPRVTAWMGLCMLGLAFFSIFIFERKSFCRYGCLIGRISGLYALFAPIEIRSKNKDACRSCATNSCYKGNDQGEPCPTFQHLSTMDQNTYCIACMECAKSCEKKNVAVNLRPWGEDLVSNLRPRSDEAYLALLMLSLTGFHGLTMTPAWGEVINWIEVNFKVGETLAFSLGMAGIMIGPPILYAVLVAISRWASQADTIGYRDYFIRYAYALLPIALFYHLAHNSEHLLMEGQKAIALISDPMGFEWDLLGTAGLELPPLINLPTLWVVQVFFVMVGHVYSLWAARRAAGFLFPDSRAALRSQVPMLVAMILFSLMSLWLLKQPMEMRTSAM